MHDWSGSRFHGISLRGFIQGMRKLWMQLLLIQWGICLQLVVGYFTSRHLVVMSNLNILGDDCWVIIWDCHSGKRLHDLLGHQHGPVVWLLWFSHPRSGEESMILFGCANGTIHHYSYHPLKVCPNTVYNCFVFNIITSGASKKCWCLWGITWSHPIYDIWSTPWPDGNHCRAIITCMEGASKL